MQVRSPLLVPLNSWRRGNESFLHRRFIGDGTDL
jgi:hypothetical protein